MALKHQINKELTELKAWATDVNFQARLAKAEASSELRKAWMEAEQDLAKLEVRLEQLGNNADASVDALVERLKGRWSELKSQLS
jgi:phage shock protein A